MLPANRLAKGRLQPPSSKSLTQRALNLALLGGAPCQIDDPLMSEDTELFLAGLEALGMRSERQEDRVVVEVGERPPEANLWCGNNGTMLRFLTGSVCTVPGEWTLDGTDRLRQRPVAPLVDALRALGARVTYGGEEGFAPLTVVGGTLVGGAVDLDASLSSQFASALMMAATRSIEGVSINLRGLVSEPYLTMTRRLLVAHGGLLESNRESGVLRVRPGAPRLGRFHVEVDFSSAAYPAAAAVVTGGSVVLVGLGRQSFQGDKRFLDVLEQMGARVDWSATGVRVGAGEPLRGIEADFADIPDQVPTLAALAPFASGETVIRNVGHLRIKESDRLAAMATELSRLGAVIEETRDGLRIEGTWSDPENRPSEPVEVDSHADHRVAMSLAICGLARPGVTVGNAAVVAKSYPTFWDDLDRLIQE